MTVTTIMTRRWKILREPATLTPIDEEVVVVLVPMLPEEMFERKARALGRVGQMARERRSFLEQHCDTSTSQHCTQAGLPLFSLPSCEFFMFFQKHREDGGDVVPAVYF